MRTDELILVFSALADPTRLGSRNVGRRSDPNGSTQWRPWVEHHRREWDDRLDRLEARIDTLVGGPDHEPVPASTGDDV